MKTPRLARAEMLWGYLFTAPAIVGLVLFTAGPIVAVVRYSFSEYNMLRPPEWIGFANYERLWADPLFWKALRNTLIYVAGTVPLGIALALAFALLLDRSLRGIRLFRTIFFLPVVSPVVAVGLIWSWIYQRDTGLLNLALGKMLGAAGIEATLPAWTVNEHTAIWAVVLMAIWKGLGYNIVILLAGLQEVPRDLAEAAEIDGAGPWQRFRHVTLPMLSPTLFFVAVIATIGGFQVFEPAYMLRVAEDYSFSVHTVVWHIYETAFIGRSQMGYASAMGVVLALIIFALTAVQLAVQRRWVHFR